MSSAAAERETAPRGAVVLGLPLLAAPAGPLPPAAVALRHAP